MSSHRTPMNRTKVGVRAGCRGRGKRRMWNNELRHGKSRCVNSNQENNRENQFDSLKLFHGSDARSFDKETLGPEYLPMPESITNPLVNYRGEGPPNSF